MFLLKYSSLSKKEVNVKIAEMREVLDAEVFVGHDYLAVDIKDVGCDDSMADALFFGKSGIILLTGLTNPHVVHIADSIGIADIIIFRGKHPPPETIQLAEKAHIPLLSTDYILFETACRPHERGLIGCMQKVKKRT